MTRGDMRAFPGRAFDEEGTEWIHPGMTIREYFAAAALRGILANPAVFDFRQAAISGYVENTARCADAQLAELKKGDE